jgi:hypothetical protein
MRVVSDITDPEVILNVLDHINAQPPLSGSVIHRYSVYEVRVRCVDGETEGMMFARHLDDNNQVVKT